ncbi:hypothetical protein [Streptomyces sp. CB01580]|uniref:hypothetical protein n=1 Tax=Streptomyces sp. CB01580 TaxID=1703933 RepID=UPI00093BDD7A|nr:hypothetical protein [Streptomyces sp. CB01580]OKJ42683.1 hypothetical protein AMK22_07605 [Streptomyces sp. CB01580]
MPAVTNPEELAALEAVPDIERTRKLHASAEDRLRRHRAGETPDEARNRVVEEAVNSFITSGTWPRDVGSKAAKANTEAVEWEAERLALKRAVDAAEDLAHDTRQVLSDDALEFLGTRLAGILSAVRTAAEALGDVRSAEGAIKAGGAAVEAWGTLSVLLEDYRNVRRAQWSFLMPQRHRLDLPGVHEESSRELKAWQRDGHGHVAGFDPDNVPADALSAMKSGQYTIGYLRWIASAGTAYVPRSREDLKLEVMATNARHEVVYDDNGPIQRDPYAWHETPIPAPRPAEVYPHSTVPQMDYSKPQPPKPTPNATVSDERAPRTF